MCFKSQKPLKSVEAEIKGFALLVNKFTIF